MTGVEAAAISGLVSGSFKVVGNKLAALLIKEYSSIVGVKEDLQELHDLVEDINIWLEKTADNSIGSTQSFAWLKKLKDISYEVDDVVDEFQLKAEKHDSNADSGTASKYLCTIPKSFVFQYKAANKIKAIKKRFAAVVKQRTDYIAITNSLSVDPPVRLTNMRTMEVLSLSNIDEELVVGRDKDKQEIITMLEQNDDQQKIKIVSVIGLGGSGKTTLAKLVFNDGNIIEKHFDVRLWVHVSQEFHVKDLIKKLFEAFSDNNAGPHALPYMIKTISDKLTGKRFLLVLDDVWTNSRHEWEEFMVYIKVGAPKSRILLTTRNREVAVIVGSTDEFHLPLLSPYDSWQLFQQSLVTVPTGWDLEFEEVGKAIVDKCGGMPLAIKVLAGALHGKERIEDWQKMRDKNLSHSNVNGKEDRIDACLRLSYFHLPSNLKQCFTICSMFPKGHKIDKEQLIDLWIAHDMITVEDGADSLELEYVGHKHFHSLLQVSFLQNVEEAYGRVTCGMHDLVHDLALSILGEEIALDMPNGATCTAKSYRYISLINWPEHLAPKNIRKVRAVYMPWYGDYTYVMALKHAKHLRSVMVGYLDTEKANTISQLKYLKYLAMSLRTCETLPKGISNVWSLQALHVTQSFSLVEIPKSICKLKMLRTLNLSGCIRLNSLPDSIGDCQMISSINLYRCSKLTALPDSIGKLQRLRTLNLSSCHELKCLPDSIGDCQMISSIYLCNCSKLTMLPNSVGKLQKFGTLNLSLCEELKCLPDSIGDCQMISSIDLCGCSKLTVLTDSVGKSQKLRTLNLSRCRELKCLTDSIGDCQMISSIDLSSCRKLTVLTDSIGRNEVLRVLRLSYTKVERIPSIITTLRNLECLDLQGCYELVELPEGIGNLEKLLVLNLRACYQLGGIPVGIGQLRHLEKLGLFVLGKGEKFAGISELANLSRIGEELEIRGISYVLDPNVAHEACLKQKTNLQRLSLQWMTDDIEDINTELEQAVLDGLEPSPRIEELGIHSYSGRQCARWMQNQVCGGVQVPIPFPFLRMMVLNDLPNLKHIHGLVELPCLEELRLKWMPSLESISGGPFPSLRKLIMESLPSLGEMWMVAQRNGEVAVGCCNFTPQLRQVRVGNCLTELEINDCPNLEVKPHLPLSLESLQLGNSEKVLQSAGQCQGSSSSPSFSHLKKLQLQCMPEWRLFDSLESNCWELLQHMTSLESLEISRFSREQLPKTICSLTSLRFVRVENCSNIHIHKLLEWIGEIQSLQELTIESSHSLTSLPHSIGHLTSLQTLCIRWCNALQQLPDCLGELCSLRKLEIRALPCLTCLPQSICRLTTSLQELEIVDCLSITSLPQGMEGLVSLGYLSVYKCPGIQSLPEGIKGLTALKELEIYGCPDLEKRCERETGEDWHLISHIPNVRIG